MFEGVGASLIASVVFEGVRAALDRRAIAREFDAALDDAHQTFRHSHPGFPVEIFDKVSLYLW